MKDFIAYYVQHCPKCGEYVGESSIHNEECYECHAALSKNQRHHALNNPNLYGKEIVLPNNLTSTVIRQAEHLQIDAEISRVFGLFAVTDRGIECLSHEYFIEFSQINGRDWLSHMKEKSWVVIEDFINALEYAKSRPQI